MGKAVWTTFVVASFLGVLGYFAFNLFVFVDEPSNKKIQDPLVALLETPPKSLHPLAESGSGKWATSNTVQIPLTPLDPPKDTSTDAAIHSALFPTTNQTTEDLEKSHEETAIQLHNIENELAALPGGPDSAPARSVLLHTASTLDLNEQEADEVHELAMNELLQGVDAQSPQIANASSFAYFLPVLAHEVALKTAFDPAEAMNITIDGVLVQQDPSIRTSLVRQFLARYPDLEPNLREQLYFRNVWVDAPVGANAAN